MAAVTYFPGADLIVITPALLAQVKQAAAEEPLRRARLCLHPGPADPLHEMVVAFCRDAYLRPHRHRGKSESFHIIEGELDVIFFDDSGRITRRLELGPVGSGRAFFYRLASHAWHTIVLRTETAVIHETTNGPFNPADCEFAPWSPAPGTAPPWPRSCSD